MTKLVPDSPKYPLAKNQADQSQNQTSTGGWAKLIKIKIGAKMTLTVNSDI